MEKNKMKLENTVFETSIFDKKYTKSIDVYGEIDSLYKELSYKGALPIIQCNSIRCENLIWTSVKWALYKDDGIKLLESQSYSIDEIWHKKLLDLDILPNTALILKSNIGKDCNTSNVLLEYNPLSKDIAYFQLIGNTLNINLNFIGIHEEIF